MKNNTKVALIGHTLPEPAELDLPKNPMKAKALLSLHNYARVVTDENKLECPTKDGTTCIDYCSDNTKIGSLDEQFLTNEKQNSY